MPRPSSIRRIQWAALCIGSVCQLGLVGCERLLQQNFEVLLAPAVIENGFLLPMTFVFRLLRGLL